MLIEVIFNLLLQFLGESCHGLCNLLCCHVGNKFLPNEDWSKLSWKKKRGPNHLSGSQELLDSEFNDELKRTVLWMLTTRENISKSVTAESVSYTDVVVLIDAFHALHLQGFKDEDFPLRLVSWGKHSQKEMSSSKTRCWKWGSRGHLIFCMWNESFLLN